MLGLPCRTKFLEQMFKYYAKTDAKLYAKFFGFYLVLLELLTFPKIFRLGLCRNKTRAYNSPKSYSSFNVLIFFVTSKYF